METKPNWQEFKEVGRAAIREPFLGIEKDGTINASATLAEVLQLDKAKPSYRIFIDPDNDLLAICAGGALHLGHWADKGAQRSRCTLLAVKHALKAHGYVVKGPMQVKPLSIGESDVKGKPTAIFKIPGCA